MIVNGNGQRYSAGLGVLKLKPRQRVQVHLQTEAPLEVWTHWLGRRLWCLGEGCPACEHVSGRLMVYSIGTVHADSGTMPFLIETTGPAWERMAMLAESSGLTVGPGLIIELTRDKPRSPLRLDPLEAGGKQLEPLRSWRRAASAAAKLAALPSPHDGETCEEFSARLRPRVLHMLEVAIQAGG